VVDVVAHADSSYLNSIVLGELLGGFAADLPAVSASK
jgi:hypothetical protein